MRKRVINKNGLFFCQEKGLFGWRDMKLYCCDELSDWTEPITFTSIEKAECYLNITREDKIRNLLARIK